MSPFEFRLGGAFGVMAIALAKWNRRIAGFAMLATAAAKASLAGELIDLRESSHPVSIAAAAGTLVVAAMVALYGIGFAAVGGPMFVSRTPMVSAEEPPRSEDG